MSWETWSNPPCVVNLRPWARYRGLEPPWFGYPRTERTRTMVNKSACACSGVRVTLRVTFEAAELRSAGRSYDVAGRFRGIPWNPGASMERFRRIVRIGAGVVASMNRRWGEVMSGGLHVFSFRVCCEGMEVTEYAGEVRPQLALDGSVGRRREGQQHSARHSRCRPNLLVLCLGGDASEPLLPQQSLAEAGVPPESTIWVWGRSMTLC